MRNLFKYLNVPFFNGSGRKVLGRFNINNYLIAMVVLSPVLVLLGVQDLFGIGLKVVAYPEVGKAAVAITNRFSIDKDSQVRIGLFSRNNLIAVQDIRLSGGNVADAFFDMGPLEPGDYDVRIFPDQSTSGKAIERASFSWKGQPAAFKKIKILNNFVWELLSLDQRKLRHSNKYIFTNPDDRWVYVKASFKVQKGGKAWVSIDRSSRDAALIYSAGPGGYSTEAMRFLAAGEHKLFIGRKGKAVLKNLVVRSVPVLQYAFYDTPPKIAPFGPYDWEFLSKYVLPDVNEIISETVPVAEHLKAWKAHGGKWLLLSHPYGRDFKEPAEVAELFNHWTDNDGFRGPLMDGVIVDEFEGGNDPVYDRYREAVKLIHKHPEFKDKLFIPYGGVFYHKDRSNGFAKECIKAGGYICIEHYLSEQPTAEEAESYIRRSLLPEAIRWEEGIPGVLKRMIVALGYFSQPTESLHTNPGVNFKTYMDMQIHFLATHPAFFGLGGIQEYNSSYADEETVRWASRLYRHYCIEGRVDPLSVDPYNLSHIKNGDFEENDREWRLSPAEKKSIRFLSHRGYGWLEGRYPKSARGDTFLLMKRSSEAPNVISQEIKNLVPARLYSLTIITGDYRDLSSGKSVQTEHLVDISIDNAEMLRGKKKSFQFPFQSAGHTLGKFNRTFPFWMNYHCRVFRAEGTTATLTIKDWKSGDAPGGPIGQELTVNFIQIQPYLNE